MCVLFSLLGSQSPQEFGSPELPQSLPHATFMRPPSHPLGCRRAANSSQLLDSRRLTRELRLERLAFSLRRRPIPSGVPSDARRALASSDPPSARKEC